VPVDPALYRRHRFPAEIIGHAGRLYLRFNLSHRDVEELLAERGIRVSYEAIRLWCRKFGPAYTDELRRQPPCPADTWYVDEMQLKIRGKTYWLWRAVDQDGFVLDILVQERRNEQAAVAFLRRVLAAGGGAPRVIVTDKLSSYVPTVKRLLSIRPRPPRWARSGRALTLEQAVDEALVWLGEPDGLARIDEPMAREEPSPFRLV
jgi:putative transposase